MTEYFQCEEVLLDCYVSVGNCIPLTTSVVNSLKTINPEMFRIELSFRIPYHFLHLLCKCMGRSLNVPSENL